MIAAIRKVTDIPVAVGFGINTTDQAANIAKIADGVIVGSAIVKNDCEVRHSCGAAHLYVCPHDEGSCHDSK